jgi:ribosomal-protein-alanine N-acetyltransferase
MTELPDLQGACVLLQPLRETHAAALSRVLRDPELWRFMDDASPTSEAALAERYRRLESRRSPDNLQYWLNWAIVVPTEVIGFVQATVTNEAADIAYVIGREYQSRGHATDAVRAMLAFVEEALGVTTEYATVDARNKPSRMLLERLGFTLADGEDMQNLRFMRALR